MNVAVSVVIFLAVIAFLVYISINKNSVMDTNTNVQSNEEDTQAVAGVKTTIIKEGSGEAAKPGDVLSMNYTGKLVDGTVFDSNVDPKFNHPEPFVFVLGAGQVIQGWETGILGMKVGEKRILEISPEMGYGERSIGSIPANSTLVFEVELLEIKK